MAPIFRTVLKTISNIEIPILESITTLFFDTSDLFDIPSSTTSTANELSPTTPHTPASTHTYTHASPTTFSSVLSNPSKRGLCMSLLYLIALAVLLVRSYDRNKSTAGQGLGVERRGGKKGKVQELEKEREDALLGMGREVY